MSLTTDEKAGVLKFFLENRNPSDSDLHDWAESFGLETELVKEYVYELATNFVEMMFGGVSGEKNTTKADVDPEQLKIGIAVEKEHTGIELVAEKIALDHLAEMPDYYTRLKQMEEGN